MDINREYGCGSIMDSDMTLGYSSGLDITMAPGVSVGHSDLYEPNRTLKYQHGLLRWPRTQAVSQSSTIIGAMDISIEFDCGRTWIQTWSSAAVQVQMSPWLREASQAILVSIAPVTG